MPTISISDVFVSLLLTLIVYLTVPILIYIFRKSPMHQKLILFIAIANAVGGICIFAIYYHFIGISKTPNWMPAFLWGTVAYSFLRKKFDKGINTTLTSVEHPAPIDSMPSPDRESLPASQVLTPEIPSVRTRTVYCKFCGSPIDNVTKKCAGCGKQYFHVSKKMLQNIWNVASILIIFGLAGFSLYAVNLSNENYKLYQEQNSLIQSKELQIQEVLEKVSVAEKEMASREETLNRYVFVIPNGSKYHAYNCPHLANDTKFAAYRKTKIPHQYQMCPDCYGTATAKPPLK
ncbi:hypothetical protein [Anaerotruncus rubiinfantis]|uniref:hypothetical protein n=1 Tax=Anaerotruncus rubiinfantis TaxID=1720200 RepID=UPI003D78F4AE